MKIKTSLFSIILLGASPLFPPNNCQSVTNEHSLRDFILEIPWLGTVETGNSGFRFARIDLLDKEVELPIRSVRAIAQYRDILYLGSFKSSDERLNKIWETGANTVQLKRMSQTCLSSMKKYVPPHRNNKQAAALLSITNIISPRVNVKRAQTSSITLACI